MIFFVITNNLMHSFPQHWPNLRYYRSEMKDLKKNGGYTILVINKSFVCKKTRDILEINTNCKVWDDLKSTWL